MFRILPYSAPDWLDDLLITLLAIGVIPFHFALAFFIGYHPIIFVLLVLISTVILLRYRSKKNAKSKKQ